MRHSAPSPLLIIPLIVIGWIGFFAHNSLRKADVVDAYLDMKIRILHATMEEIDAPLDRLRTGKRPPAFWQRLANRLPLFATSREVLVLDGRLLYCDLPGLDPVQIGKAPADVFAEHQAFGMDGYERFLDGLSSPGTGRARFIWDGGRGPEQAIWATVARDGHVLSAAVCTPEESILDYSGTLTHIRRETLVLIAISLLLLLLMVTLIRQGRRADRYRERLEQTVAERTGELTLANRRLRKSLDSRKMAEEALRASEEKYRMLVEHQNDVMVRADRRGRLGFASPSYCDLIGKPEREVVGSRLFAVIHKDDRRKVYQAMRGLARPPHTFQVQARAHTRLGVRWMSWAGKAVLREDGGVAEVVGIGRDITDTVLANEHIANSLAEKELLLQEIHHRVKNNLQIICSLLDMASRRLHSPLDKELFQDVHSKIEGMSLIHSQLYQSEQFDRIDMSEYASALFEQLANMYGAKNLTARMETEPVPLPINLAIPCGLVLNEVLTNVLKHAFTDEGGTVRLVLRREGPMVRLAVADDGRGLPEDWEVRGEKAMGVKLMRNIVQFQLGGTLAVHTGGGGAAFDISFPFERE